MTIPVVNATLLSIGGQEFTADYDEPATSHAPRWTGQAAAYVVEEILTLTAGGQGARAAAATVDEVVRTYIIVDAALGQTIWPGDTVTYSHQGKTVTRTARNVRVTPIVDTARVTFEPI